MRILLRELPPLLRDMLAQALASRPGVELISEPPPPVPEPAAALPDVVILSAEDPDAAGTPAVLRRWPRSRVLLISATGQRASLVELRPHRTALGEMTLVQLLQVVTQSPGREN